MRNIKLIAPSSGIDSQTEAVEFLEKASFAMKERGYELIYDPEIFSGTNLPFFAASHEFRLKDISGALTDSSSNIIWAARGGYGSANIVDDLIDLLDARIINDKILIGFSDITVLHLLLNQVYNLPTIHGPNLFGFVNSGMNFDIFSGIFSGILSNKQTNYSLTRVKNDSSVAESAQITGKMTGGNLTVLESLIGTNLHPNFDGKILLLEDVNEAPYRIHRSLMHMKRASLLDKVSAIIFADFTQKDPAMQSQMDHMIRVFCEEELGNIPCFRMAGVGHGEVNLPIAFGVEAEICIEGEGLSSARLLVSGIDISLDI